MNTIVLDISRSISRVSQGRLTGIDRVELAYIRYFLNVDDPVFFHARFRGHNVLLNKTGMQVLFQLIENDGPWDELGLLAGLRKKKRSLVHRVVKTIRRLSISDTSLVRGLKNEIPNGFYFINVGHGRLKPAIWPKLRKAGAKKIILMIHDVIPLDFPQFCSPKSTAAFEERIRAAAENTDIFLFNSTDTSEATHVWLKKWGVNNVESHVVLLGTDALPEQPKITTSKITHPYFVILGTVEPRKNHRLLLDIWAEFHQTLPEAEIPHLYIVGARGWMNEDVFALMDNAAFMGSTVHDSGRVSDEELGALLSGAKALLFPSFAEGFGYPLVEAMQKDIPVICSDLASFKELADGHATFISPQDQEKWQKTILEFANNTSTSEKFNKIPPIFPDWQAHFHKVATILGDSK